MTFGQSSVDWANTLGAVFCSLLFVVVFMAFYVVLFYRIFKRAGYNGWLGLVSLIPGVGLLICLCILAFDTWPVKKYESESSVRCHLPGHGEGTFIPDQTVAPAPVPAPVAPIPAPAPVTPAPTPAPVAPTPAPVVPVAPVPPATKTLPVLPDHPEIPDHPAVPDVPAPKPQPPAKGGQSQ